MSAAGVVVGESKGEAGAKKRPSGAQQRKAAQARREAAEELRKAEEAARAAMPPGEEDELTAIRWVMSHSADRTFQHWMMRQSWRRNPEKFEDNYHRLLRVETESRSSSAISVTSNSPAIVTGLDQGQARIDPLLIPEFQEWEEFLEDREEWRKWKASAIISSTH